MIKLHHLESSRSKRILWLLEELQVDYEIIYYKRDKLTMLAPASLKKIHPLGKSPIITDGELTIAESGAIIEYLVNKYDQGKLKPKEGTADALKYTYWLHYAEASAIMPLILNLIFNKIETSPMPFFVRPIAKLISLGAKKSFILPQQKLHLSYMNDELKNGQWFAGDQLSAADIQMSFPIEAAATTMNLAQKYPNLAEFLKRIEQRKAYQEATKKGGGLELFK